MIKSGLVIVPHQDDELNICGGLMEILVNSGVEVHVLYVTMGNFYREKTAARQKERERSLKVFGNIKYKQLSYDDSYKVENHKFNDMAMRANIKADIKSYISEVMADMIICVDFDSHADHKMVSSLFDQIMKEMIVENGYRPLVLKKFAYLGVWGVQTTISAKRRMKR